MFFREAWFFDAASGWFEEIFEGEWIWLVVIFIGEGVLFFLSGDLVVDVEGGFWALLRDILFRFLRRMTALDGGLVCEGIKVIDEAGTGFFGLFADGRALLVLRDLVEGLPEFLVLLNLLSCGLQNRGLLLR